MVYTWCFSESMEMAELLWLEVDILFLHCSHRPQPSQRAGEDAAAEEDQDTDMLRRQTTGNNWTK